LKVKLLRSSTSEDVQLQVLTTFLINDRLAIDGGSLGLALGPGELPSIRNIVITHAHTDHIASLPIFVADAFAELETSICVYALPEVVSALRSFIFNDQIWPNFEGIPLRNGTGPAMVFRPVKPGERFEIDGIIVTPILVNHVVPTMGLKLEDRDTAVIFTSDTYITNDIWEVARESQHLKAVFVDVSFPNEMEALAAASKHLTPQTLASELSKIGRQVQVYATHLKPGSREQVANQLNELKNPAVSVVEVGRTYEW
jgi:cAMP phosphodiesterase